MTCKKLMAATLLWAALATPAGAFDYNQSVDEIAESPLTAYQTVYLGMPRADFDANFSILPDWTFYGSTVSFTERAERTSVVKNVSVTEGIEIFSADTSAKGKVLAFDNYFKTTDKATAKSIYSRLVATIYSNMENFPVKQSDKEVEWTQDDVSIDLPWHWYLKKLVGSVTSTWKKTTMRRNRRQPERLDLPGCLRSHTAKILIGLDISGSITDAEFRQAIGEVLHLVRCYNHEIIVAECDDEIRRTYRIRTMDDVRGRLDIRGGTAYSPVFAYANTQRVDLVVYFTDGKGEEKLQTPPKGYKVLWVLSGKGDKLSLKKSFGLVKHLTKLPEYDPSLDFDDVEKGGFSMNHQEGISMP